MWVWEQSGSWAGLLATALMGALLAASIVQWLRAKLARQSPPEKPGAGGGGGMEQAPEAEYTLDDLAACKGEGGGKILMGVAGKVLDVTGARDFYGPGGAYSLFAGRDASRALAKMSFEEELLANPSTANLSQAERDTLLHWERKLCDKYPVVGRLRG